MCGGGRGRGSTDDEGGSGGERQEERGREYELKVEMKH